ncbi:hypothetical protein [Ochrobactrum sp. RH2CCR150]|nr:hypothetical protein [Ochrobactrum sp. RH2CCR150]
MRGIDAHDRTQRPVGMLASGFDQMLQNGLDVVAAVDLAGNVPKRQNL